MIQTVLDILRPALLRFAGYVALIAFGIIGAFITKLGLGVYDEVAQTITITRDAFVAGVVAMISVGFTAAVAYLKGWTGRAGPPK